MTTTPCHAVRRCLAGTCALLACLLLAAPAASARQAPALAWAACGVAAAVECATLQVPLDYDRPGGDTLDVHVARVPAADPATRLGTLVFNFGGPGAAAAAAVEGAGRNLFPALSARYDVIGLDPRGTGQTEGAIDCEANQETQGIYSQPFLTPLNVDARALPAKARGYVQRCTALNSPRLLRHFSTANVARDFDALRTALGEAKLNYLGFSYGTFLGATYATLFPNGYDRMVLDGPLDAEGYINRPGENLLEQTSGFERALGRFLHACAADQVACSGFGGADPWLAYDALIDRAEATPIPADGYTPDPRPVDADDVRAGTLVALYSRGRWGLLAYALALADAGDATYLRLLADAFYGRNVDGTYAPGLDRYFVLGAIEQRFDGPLARSFRAGNLSWGQFDHFYVNAGYLEVNYRLWRARDRDAFRGPFGIADGAPRPLVVASTYDAATPYNGARRLVHDLGNVSFLKVRGDTHTAYRSAGACAAGAIDAYLLEGTEPAPGTVCISEQPFARFEPRAAARRAAPALVGDPRIPALPGRDPLAAGIG